MRPLRTWDEARGDYVGPAGEVEIQVGASSADLRQAVRLRLPTPGS